MINTFILYYCKRKNNIKQNTITFFIFLEIEKEKKIHLSK